MFNQNLVYLRDKRGLKQREVAAMLSRVCKEEVKLDRYQQWEYGKAEPPLRILVGLCEVLQFKDIYALLTKKLAE